MRSKSRESLELGLEWLALAYAHHVFWRTLCEGSRLVLSLLIAHLTTTMAPGERSEEVWLCT